MLGVERKVNCDLRCRKATVDAEQVRKLAKFAKQRPKVWLLLNIGYGLFMQEDGNV